MYVFIYVCMYVCMHACMHVCMYVRLYVCKCARVHVRMHVCMYACMHARMYVCMHACMHARMYVCMYVCMYALGSGAEREVHICGVRGGGSTLRIAAVSRPDAKGHRSHKVLHIYDIVYCIEISYFMLNMKSFMYYVCIYIYIYMTPRVTDGTTVLRVSSPSY